MYTTALSAVKAVFGLSAPSVQVWARNSYAAGTIVPFVSDLDLTMFVPPGAGEEATKQGIAVYRVLQRVMPLLCEVNLYVEDECRAWIRFMNSFELQRDPILTAKVNGWHVQPVVDREIEAIVFVLRMAAADVKNLAARPSYRQEKWQRHFSDIGWKSNGDIGLREISRLVVEKTGMSGGGAVESLHEYMLRSGKNESVESLVRELRRQPLWALLFPHRFCFAVSDVVDSMKSFLSNNPPPVTGRMIEIFIGQCAWEVCGIGAQRQLIANQVELVQHYRNFHNLLRNAGPLVGDREWLLKDLTRAWADTAKRSNVALE